MTSHNALHPCHVASGLSPSSGDRHPGDWTQHVTTKEHVTMDKRKWLNMVLDVQFHYFKYYELGSFCQTLKNSLWTKFNVLNVVNHSFITLKKNSNYMFNITYLHHLLKYVIFFKDIFSTIITWNCELMCSSYRSLWHCSFTNFQASI